LLFLQLIMKRLRREPAGRAAVVVPNTTLFYGGVATKVRRLLVADFNLHTIVRLPKGVFEPYTDIETNILFFDAGRPTDNILYYRLQPPDERKQYTKTQPLTFDEFGEVRRLIAERSSDSPHAWFVAAETLAENAACNLDHHNPKVIRDVDEPPEDVLDRVRVTLAEADARLASATAFIATLAELTADRRRWVAVSLGRALKRRRDVVEIIDDETYKRLRIQVKGRGVLLRDEVPGAEIGTKRQFRVEEGQFVLSKIDARNGAFGIVPEECDKAIITGNFWAYEVDTDALSPRLLKYLTQSDQFIHFCTVSSPGATNRRYLQEDQFLAQTAGVPKALEAQEALAEALDGLAAVTQSGESALAQLSKQFPVLLQSALHQVFGSNTERSELSRARRR